MKSRVDHYKADSYFTLAPGEFNVQEADGTPASLGNWDAAPRRIRSLLQYGEHGQRLYQRDHIHNLLRATDSGRHADHQSGVRCDYELSALAADAHPLSRPRSLRFQSSSIKNIAMNGDVRYSISNSKLPNYYENFQGLDGAIRTATFTGNAHRTAAGGEHGLRRDLAGDQDDQPVRSARLLQCSSARQCEHYARNHAK